MINEKLYTRTGIQDYHKLGDLDSQRGQLVATLNHSLSSISYTLSAPMQNLSLSLDSYAKSDDKDEDKN
jgi:hypothetical protein